MYHNWATIAKSFTHQLDDDKRVRFNKAQESTKEDVKHTFGILKGKWHLLERPDMSVVPQ